MRTVRIFNRLAACLAGVILVGVALAGCAGGSSGGGTGAGAGDGTDGSGTSSDSGSAVASATGDGFDKTAYSIDDPQSIWVVVNKLRPLNPTDYAPTDLVKPDIKNVNGQYLRQVTSDALAKLMAAAKADGVTPTMVSGYRPFALQKTLYNTYVAQSGQALADTFSARPGYSEHQTGLALDFGDSSGDCSLEACFDQTAAGRWLALHAWEYGFILRYPEYQTGVTGYKYEPWHFRYVGVDLATEMHNTGITTLEEFFGLPDAPDYAG